MITNTMGNTITYAIMGNTITNTTGNTITNTMGNMITNTIMGNSVL